MTGKTFDFDERDAVPLAAYGVFPEGREEIDDGDTVSSALTAADHRLLVSAMRIYHRRMIRRGDPRVVPAAALIERLEDDLSRGSAQRRKTGRSGRNPQRRS